MFTNNSFSISAAPPRPSPRAWFALAVLCLAELLLVVDITAANVALPTIGAELGLASAQLAGVVAAYVVTFGGLMLLGGRLADQVGRRRMLLFGLAVFVLASLVCGLAADGSTLIAGRALQGVGAALLSPAALSAVAAAFSGADRTRALGVWAGVGGIGFAGGLVLSGALTAGPGWRWVFLVNVPLGLAIAIAVLSSVPRDARVGGARLDLGGAVLGTLTAGGLVAGLALLGEPGAASYAEATLLTALATGIWFTVHELRHPAPLLPIRVLRRRTAVGGLLAMLFASGTMVGTFFVASLTVQRELGLDPLATGLAFLAPAVALAASAHLGGRLLVHRGPRVVGTGAFAIAAIGAVVLAEGHALGSLAVLEAGLVVVCLGIGAAFVVATTSALADAGHADAGAISGLVNTGHELGGAFGVAVATPALAIGAGMSAAGAGALPAALAAVGAIAAAVLALAVFPARPVPVAAGHAH